jgi:hypothetical protein
VKDFFDLDRLVRIPLPDPLLSLPPEDLLDRVVFGGVARGLVPLANQLERQRSLGERAVPDADTLARAAQDGLQEAQDGLVAGLREGAAAVEAMVDAVAAGARRVRLAPPDLGLRAVRIVLDAVQVADSTDPALAGDAVALTVRVVADEQVVAAAADPGVPVPDPDRRGTLLRPADPVAAELLAWEGSEVRIEVEAADAAQGVEAAERNRRCSLTLRGSPASWLGTHRGADEGGDWRIWVSVVVGD